MERSRLRARYSYTFSHIIYIIEEVNRVGEGKRKR